MSEWQYAQVSPEDRLAKIDLFSVVKRQDGREIEFTIRVKEYLTPPDPAMRFYAEADRQTNQRTAPYTPFGWGATLMMALSDCVEAIHRFPCEDA